MLVKNVIIHYPHIFEARRFINREKYGIAFKIDDQTVVEELKAKGINYNNDKQLFNAYSARPIQIKEASGDYALLKQAFDIAEIRNISKDRLFIELLADLEISFYNYDRNDNYTQERYFGVGISIV